MQRYFHAYGGWADTVSSPLFLLSIIITAISYSHWISPDWLPLSQSLVPSLLGFSLGTYALLFSLMTGRLKRALKLVKNSRNISYLDEINATFFHFIMVQVICLVWGVLYSGRWLVDLMEITSPYFEYPEAAFFYLAATGSFIGHFFLVYSILLVIASAQIVYRLASITDPADS
nr:hypothetical protein [Mycoplana azooxidifex]